MMKRWIVLVLALVGCLAGCNSAGPKSLDEAMEYVDKFREIGKEQGVSWHATIVWDGKPGFAAEETVYLRTGVSLNVHFQGNAGGPCGAGEDAEAPPETEE